MRTWTVDEIQKMIDTMVGMVEPVADSQIDAIVMDNVKVLISVVDRCFDELCDVARHRKSFYGSQREIGEYVYSAMLNWRDWLAEVEEEYA